MSGSILGRAVRRVEDPAFLTGAARYLEDVDAVDCLHVAFVRSTFAHGTILGVDTTDAAAMPGVVGVFTAGDLDLPRRSDLDEVPGGMARPPLADGVVRFVGEPVAAVVAETKAQALDAAEMVGVDFEPLAAVTDPISALEPGAPVLFPEFGSNVVVRWTGPGEPRALEPGEDFPDSDPDRDPLEGAEVVVRGRFVNQRLAPVPMEPNGILAAPDGEGGLAAWCGSQSVFTHRSSLAKALGLAEDRVRVISPPVGGGFGAKFDAYAEQIVVAALALRLGRPVRTVETRSENLVAMTHGRGQIQDVELGATRDGVITGLRIHVIQDAGAYPSEGAIMPVLTGMMVSGAYRIPRIEFRAMSVATTTTPTAAYRGAGRPEAAALVERAMDLLASELGLDPADVRRRNFVPPEAFPYETPCGTTYDSGEYAAALDLAQSLADYDGLRRDQRERRARGDRWQLGIGLASYVEITAWGSEFGSVDVDPDGSVTVRTGLGPTGQGHETAMAQLVAGTLGVDMAAVRVVHSDTGAIPRGEGTGGSRSLQIGGTAVSNAGLQVVEKAKRVAAHLLEAAPDDIVLFDDGKLGVAGAPDTAVGWPEVAAAAADPAVLPPDLEPGLRAEVDFKMDGQTFPFGTHVSVVEVDIDTGWVRPVKHVAVDDCGRILNPMLVDGQVHGGVAQGLAQALHEEVQYDELGTPLTASLITYGVPSAPELPQIVTGHTETETPLNPLGAKGIGEAATIGSTPAVQNAVIDAVAHLGVRHIDLPLVPERVWRTIEEARRKANGPP